MAIQYTDWEITQRHAEIIKQHAPSSIRHLNVRKSISGLNGRRISTRLATGIWLKPRGQRPGTQWSSVQDLSHTSLVLFVQSHTSRQSAGTPEYDLFRKKITGLFHARRATGLDGELFSMVSVGDYDIDDVVARECDIDILEITSWYREDREGGDLC